MARLGLWSVPKMKFFRSPGFPVKLLPATFFVPSCVQPIKWHKTRLAGHRPRLRSFACASSTLGCSSSCVRPDEFSFMLARVVRFVKSSLVPTRQASIAIPPTPCRRTFPATLPIRGFLATVTQIKLVPRGALLPCQGTPATRSCGCRSPRSYPFRSTSR